MADHRKNSTVVAEISRNRLVFTFAETICRDDLNKLYTDVRFCVADLQPGFDAISDFTASTLLRLDSIPTLRKIMNYLITHGVREVVRIVQSDRLVYRQILNLALRVPGYKAVYVSSMPEAVKRLEFFIKRDGIRLHLPNQEVEYEFGTVREFCRLIDISTSGCALTDASPCPPVDEHILITFPFEQSATLRLSLTAKVVRSQGNFFAVQFVDMNDEHKQRLWDSLVGEIQRSGESGCLTPSPR